MPEEKSGDQNIYNTRRISTKTAKYYEIMKPLTTTAISAYDNPVVVLLFRRRRVTPTPHHPPNLSHGSPPPSSPGHHVPQG